MPVPVEEQAGFGLIGTARRRATSWSSKAHASPTLGSCGEDYQIIERLIGSPMVWALIEKIRHGTHLMQSTGAKGVAQSGTAIADLLAVDTELNAHGPDAWLKRREKRVAAGG